MRAFIAAPNLTIAVEPSEASSVVYGQLAAKSSEDAPEGQLSLALAITKPSALQLSLPIELEAKDPEN